MQQYDMLVKILHGDAGLIKTYLSQFDRFSTGDLVLITPQHVCKVLLSYIEDEMSSNELQMWADFLYPNEALYTDKHIDEDYYEVMWGVVQKISTPYLDGEINCNLVLKYYNEISGKYL